MRTGPNLEVPNLRWLHADGVGFSIIRAGNLILLPRAHAESAITYDRPALAL